MVVLQDVPNSQNLTLEQQRIIEEERQRFEAFVSQARAKCPNDTPEHRSSTVERSSSDGDLLQLFSPDPTSDGASKTTASGGPATSANFFDDFFFQPGQYFTSEHLST